MGMIGGENPNIGLPPKISKETVPVEKKPGETGHVKELVAKYEELSKPKAPSLEKTTNGSVDITKMKSAEVPSSHLMKAGVDSNNLEKESIGEIVKHAVEHSKTFTVINPEYEKAVEEYYPLKDEELYYPRADETISRPHESAPILPEIDDGLALLSSINEETQASETSTSQLAYDFKASLEKDINDLKENYQVYKDYWDTNKEALGHVLSHTEAYSEEDKNAVLSVLEELCRQLDLNVEDINGRIALEGNDATEEFKAEKDAYVAELKQMLAEISPIRNEVGELLSKTKGNQG